MNFLTQSPSSFPISTFWIIGIGIIIIIYFILREFRCWYFKTNKIIELLEEIKASIINNRTIETVEKKIERLNEIKTEIAAEKEK